MADNTNHYGLPFPEGDDGVVVHADIERLAKRLDVTIPAETDRMVNDAVNEMNPFKGRIPQDTDLNDLTEPAFYIVADGATARTLLNAPASSYLVRASLHVSVGGVDQPIQKWVTVATGTTKSVELSRSLGDDRLWTSWDTVSDPSALNAFPERSIPSPSSDALPVQWRHKTLESPYDLTYASIYEGQWSFGDFEGGQVPILDDTGRLRTNQIPGEVFDQFLRPEDISQQITRLKADLIRRTERQVSPDYPIFGARVEAAKTLGQPVNVVYSGSSTTARTPGYVVALTKALQNTYPVLSPSPLQSDPTGEFETPTDPGLHAFNVGLGATAANNYLTDEVCDNLAPLNPALFLHMIGANDWRRTTDHTVYKQRLESRLAYLDTLFPRETQHVLINVYPRILEDPLEPWELYGQAMQEIANDRPHNTRFIDVAPHYAANGIPGDDHLGFLADTVHLTPQGNAFMASLLAAHLIN